MNKITDILSNPSSNITTLFLSMMLLIVIIILALLSLDRLNSTKYGLNTKFIAKLEIFSNVVAIFPILFVFTRFDALVIKNKVPFASGVIESKISDLQLYSQQVLRNCETSLKQELQNKKKISDIIAQDNDCIKLFSNLIDATVIEQNTGRFVELKNNFSRSNHLLSAGGWTADYDIVESKLENLIHDLKAKELYLNPKSPFSEVWITVFALFFLSFSLSTKLYKPILEYKQRSL